MLLAALAWITPPAQATIIDDFSTPQGPLSSTSAAVSGPGIIGNSRHVYSGYFFEATGGLGTFSTPCCDNVMNLNYTGMSEPVDLTDGGLATSFLLRVSGVEGLGAALLFAVSDAQSSTSVAMPSIFINSPGLYAVALPTHLADFTQIDRLDIAIFLSPDSAGALLSLDFICTGTLAAGCTTADPATAVPEPSAFEILVVVSLVLPLLGRKRRGH
jgi:hypothetical protein